VSNLTDLPPILATQSADDSPSVVALEVAAGDLWVMSWDGTYQGLVCVAAVKQGYILGWPVTLPGEPAFAPAVVVDNTPVGGPLFLWPTRETGLGTHLLHRPLGRLIDPRNIQRIAWAMEDGEDPGLAFARGFAADESNAAADEAMVERWAALCFHIWPETSPLYLSETRIKRAGGNAARAAACLNLTHVALRPLWTGVRPASEAQLAALANDLGVDASTLLAGDPMKEAVDRLASPVFKEPLLWLASSAGISEGDARDRARGQYALAARDDSLALDDNRLLDAIKRAVTAGADD
jgi:transcriptional regulator with XRE-family HTH domain